MNQTSPDYYFSNIKESFPYPELFVDLAFVWEALIKKESILEKISESQIEGKVDPSVIIRGNILVGEGTVIEPQVVIDGPVIIGKNCLVRPHSYLRSGSIIGDNVVLGHGVEIKDSLIFNDCKIDSHSFVGNSIFGQGVRNGSGSITGNRRFDQKEIIIKVNSENFSTEMDKLGAIIGDYSRLGANCTTAPGTLVGQHVWAYPNSLVRGFITSNTLLKLRQEQVMAQKQPVILQNIDKNGEK